MYWFLALVRSFSVHPEYHYPGLQYSFFSPSHTFSKANNASVRNNSTFVSEAVNDLLKRSSGKQRLILDVRHVSAFVYKQKFKCEDLSVVTQISILFSRTIVYLNLIWSPVTIIEIFLEHRIYLAFAWDFGTGKFRYFQFCVLPFGLSSALFIRRFLNRFKYPGEVGAFLLLFSWTMA